MCILGDLNGWIGNKIKDGITCVFRVPGENDNSRRLVEFCGEIGLCLSNTNFKHKSLHKYTRVTMGQGRVEIKRMIDLALVKRDMLAYVQDMRAVRGMRRGLSDHHV